MSVKSSLSCEAPRSTSIRLVAPSKSSIMHLHSLSAKEPQLGREATTRPLTPYRKMPSCTATYLTQNSSNRLPIQLIRSWVVTPQLVESARIGTKIVFATTTTICIQLRRQTMQRPARPSQRPSYLCQSRAVQL